MKIMACSENKIWSKRFRLTSYIPRTSSTRLFPQLRSESALKLWVFSLSVINMKFNNQILMIIMINIDIRIAFFKYSDQGKRGLLNIRSQLKL